MRGRQYERDAVKPNRDNSIEIPQFCIWLRSIFFSPFLHLATNHFLSQERYKIKKGFKILIESQDLIDHFFDYALMVINYCSDGWEKSPAENF